MGRAESIKEPSRGWGRIPLIIVVIIALFLFCALIIIILTLTNLEKTYFYSVKFACVPEVGAAVVNSEAPFEPALYRTAVNIHNFTAETVEFTKKAVLARSEDEGRGPISEKINEALRPDQALFVDCIDISELLEDELAAQPPAAGDGFVVIESHVELDVVAIYTTELIEKKQEILYRFVTEPFKVRAVTENGAGRDELPSPGEPPYQGFRAEVLSVDFEKTFDVWNKVIYGFEAKPESPGCPGYKSCMGTREVLIPAPGLEVPFPFPDGGQDEPKSLEDLVRNLDPSFKRIIAVEATMAQKDEIKQEITYRWVSNPMKIVIDFQQDAAVEVNDLVEDEDRDGQVNEDPVDSVDNDNDGQIDEDPPLAPGQAIEILDTDIAVGVGESEDVEYIAPTILNSFPRISPNALAVLFIVIVIIVIIILAIVLFLTRKRPANY